MSKKTSDPLPAIQRSREHDYPGMSLPAAVLSFAMMLFIATTMTAFGQQIQDMRAAFNALSGETTTYIFHNPLEFDGSGGHIQGAQWLEHRDTTYVYLSGSTEKFAYCAVVELGEKPRVTNIQRLMSSPFRHAGGFQICGNLLAVGIEDNIKKDKSQVRIYAINDPKMALEDPVVTIKRSGAPKRATAGCVGLAKVRGQYILAVGDWDTRHIDMYTSARNASLSDKEPFTLASTIDIASADRSAWINDVWLSYQNINLFSDEASQLYLIGTTTDDSGADMADLYRLHTDDYVVFKLLKIDSKNFGENPRNRFRWGAGVELAPPDRISIIAAEDQIRRSGRIRIYK